MSLTPSELEALKAQKRRIDIDGVPHWIVEGDLLLTETELVEWATRKPDGKHGLVAEDHGNGTIRWHPDVVLTYRVDRSTFERDATYQLAAQHMLQATRDWMGICGVRFQHLEALDTAADMDDDAVLFQVVRVRKGGSTIASAFFPHYERRRYRVRLFDGFFLPNLGFDRTGILRHELGHVLGFRHEHIRSEAPAVCSNESLDGTVTLTDYDPQSVMHYFCGGVGDPELQFTEADRAGATAVYGPPLHAFDLRR